MMVTHADQVFRMAVTSLATNSGPLRERLETAFCDHLRRLMPRELPVELRERFEILRNDIAPRGLNTVLDHWSDDYIAKLAGEICSFSWELAHRRGGQHIG